MRILITVDPEIPVPPKHYGGIERVVAGLIKELRVRSHEVGLVANAESSCFVDYFQPWPNSLSGVRQHAASALALLNATKTFHPELVHSFSRLAYLTPILPKRLPKIMSYQRHTGGRQIAVAKTLGGTSLTFTGCSEFIAAMGRRWTSSWEAIHNFVDVNFYTFAARVKDDAPLVFLSRIERIKGVHTAIAIAKRTGRHLIIAGNRVEHAEGTNYWKTEIEPHLDTSLIEYVGPVDDHQKRELLRAAAAMIVPIEWDEPFGIVFAESLACGTPVISCARGGVPEIIRDGSEGFLIDGIESGCEAVRNLGSIERSVCRSRAENNFSAAYVADRYLDLYRRRVENRRA